MMRNTSEIASPILRAAAEGDLDTLQQMLDSGLEIDHIDEYKNTPLMVAAGYGQSEACRWLIEHGASINEAVGDSVTPLLIAIINRHINVVQMLIECGVDLNMTPPGARPPLLTALRWYRLPEESDTEIVSLLVQAGANVNLADSDGITPLLQATYRKNLELVRLFIQAGANVNQRNQDGSAALNVALRNNTPHIAALLIESGAVEPPDIHSDLLMAIRWDRPIAGAKLLENGADIEVRNRHGRTPLMMSIYADEQVLHDLIRYGADVNAVVETEPTARDAGLTALDFAAMHGKSNAMRYLIAAGADVHHGDRHGQTALVYAVEYRHAAGVKLLIDAGADIRVHDKAGTSLLELVIRTHYNRQYLTEAIEILRLLIDAGADVNTVIPKFPHSNEKPNSLLKIAVSLRDNALIQFLLERGARIDDTLSEAVRSGNREIVQRLLEQGVDINEIFASGSCVSLIDLIESEHRDIVVLLLDHGANANAVFLQAVQVRSWELAQMALDYGADVNSIGEYGATPLHSAVSCYDTQSYQQALEFTRFLLEAGASVSVQDCDGKTPFFDAVDHLSSHHLQGLELLELLFQTGADVNQKDKYGSTPLIVAASYGPLEHVRWLVSVGASINTLNAEGDSAWNIARRNERAEVAALLETHGTVEPDAVLRDFLTALQWNNTQSALSLMDSYGDVNRADHQGRTPLMIAISDFGNVEIARALLDRGADPNVGYAPDTPYSEEYPGYTPLVAACEKHRPGLVQLLFEYGATISEDGFTPLMEASRAWVLEDRTIHQSSAEIASMLLAHGAHVNTAMQDGMTALHNAVKAGNVPTVELLLEAGADARATYTDEWGEEGTSPLVDAVWAGNLEITKLLLDHGADVNYLDENGMTSVRYAVQRTEFDHSSGPTYPTDMVPLLTRYGADLNLRDTRDRSALQRSRGDEDTVIKMGMVLEPPMPEDAY